MELKRVLGLRTVVFTSAGLTLASLTFVAAASQVAAVLVGNSAWIAILIAGLLCLLAGACFSELNGILPSAAGLRLYVKHAFGDKPAITISLLYMFVITTVVGAEAFVLAKVLNRLIPLHPLIWVVVLMGLACALNIRGVKIAGNFQDLITAFVMASLIIFSLFALGKIGFHIQGAFDISGVTADGGLVAAVGAGVFLFVGFEWVTPLAEEVTHHKLVGRGMFIAIGLLSVVYALFTVTMKHYLPTEVLLTSPIPHVEVGYAVLGTFGGLWLSIVSLFCSTTTFNAGIITISRFMYASAREGVLPKFLGKFNPKYATPQNAIITLFLFGIVTSSIVYATQRYQMFVLVGAVMESVVYVVAALSVIVLRRKMKEAERPTKVWGGVWTAGLTALVFAILAEQVVQVQSPAAGVYVLIGLVLCIAYVWLAVPRIQARRAAERAALAAARGTARRAASAARD